MTEQLRIGARRLGHTRDDGYTLIESMAAAAILMVVAAGVITALIATAGWFASANTRAAATAVAAQEMAWIRSRGYADIAVGASIPSSKTVDASGGHFIVETSIASVLDTDTQLPMKRISVAVSTLGMTSPVFMVNYASENTGSPEQVYYIQNVTVNCTVANSQYNAGTPVQLRDINDLNVVSYTALTGSDNVAHFEPVREGQYWLTVDPTYPVVHAYTFPQRVVPTRNSLNTWDLTVTAPDLTGANKAYLRVGAFKAGGWYFDSIGFKPPTTLEPMEGLVIHASPQLQSSGLSQFPTQTLTYSAKVNSYGIACIPIPWTLSTRAVDNQSWHVWASTSTQSLSLETNFPGMFIAGNKWTELEQRPENPSDVNDHTTDHIPQFRYVTGNP